MPFALALAPIRERAGSPPLTDWWSSVDSLSSETLPHAVLQKRAIPTDPIVYDVELFLPYIHQVSKGMLLP